MPRKKITLIIHGWSDSSESFSKLKDYLHSKGINNIDSIYYTDWESREDNITYNDVVDGLRDRMIEKGFIDNNNNPKVDLDVIVHSTGSLIIRHWIWCYYYKNNPDNIVNCPVKKIIMLAPANFGSPLAHRGKSFFGKFLKGKKNLSDFLEVGNKILNGLELGSSYQWELAHRDLFIEKQYYCFEKIQVTILVGLDDYEGIKGWANKPGTDGTVVIAGTNINSAKLTLDFSKPNEPKNEYSPHEWSQINPVTDLAFGVLKDVDHGSIIKNASDPSHESRVSEFILSALNVKTKNDFEDLKSQLHSLTKQNYNANPIKKEYQQFLIHAIDDLGERISDYTIEFFIIKSQKFSGNTFDKKRLSGLEEKYSDEVHELLTGEFHNFSRDNSFRRFLVDNDAVKAVIIKAKEEIRMDVALSMRIYVPDIDKGIKYRTDSLQNIKLYDTADSNSNKGLNFFYKNTTTLLELRIDRYCDYVSVELNPKGK